MKRSSLTIEELLARTATDDPLVLDQHLGTRVHGWARSAEADRMLDRIISGAVRPTVPKRLRPPRRRSFRIALAVGTLLLIGAGAATAGGLLFGEAAPPRVKADLRGVDLGMPDDLRYNPDVEHARLVARFGTSKLYFADLVDGGYCMEIVTASGGGRGAVCTPGARVEDHAIALTSPFTDPVTSYSPILVGGRVNVGGAAALKAVFTDGSRQDVVFGDDRFFLFDVPDDRLPAAHRDGLTLVALDADGNEVARATLPPTDFVPPEERDAQQRIFVSTISTDADFTKVLGVEGRVNLPDAASLELLYPDGATVQIPLRSNGGYRYDLPTAREGSLYDRPGYLIARDADGHELARAPVAAVAFWRARNG